MTLTLGYAPLPTSTLYEDEVHVWLADLDVAASNSTAPEGILSPAELARAERYLHESDRQHFIAARAILRNLLGTYTETPPQEIIIEHHPNGKPFLQSKSGIKVLQFNLSHSENITLYAFSWGRQVGVDIERLRNTVDIESLARRILTYDEYADFQACAATHKTQLFYRYWTCKEAIVKASGGTLNEMSRIAVSPGHGYPAGWIKMNRGMPSDSWVVREVAPLPGYTAALVAESPVTLSFRTLKL
ncbi:MAG: 4'-phosphopantetheinyl transferase superfamily protein [Chloroflexia bacterium]